jgi:hypothetical protein
MAAPALTFTQSITSAVAALTDTDIAAIQERTSDKVLRYYNGNSRTVFELKGHPDHILKLDSPEHASMLHTIQKCRRIASLPRCVVPKVQMEFKGRHIVWIEQKLQGIFDSFEATDAAEVLYYRFREDPALREKWIEVFRQAAQFIIWTGYYDIDWRNLLLMEEGVGFVDFEGVPLEKPDLQSQGIGLLRLLAIAPLEAFDAIFKVVENNRLQNTLFLYARHLPHLRECKETMSYAEKVQLLRTIRANELALGTTLAEFHKNMDDPRKPANTSPYPAGSPERAIIDKFNQFEGKERCTTARRIRDLFLDPYDLPAHTPQAIDRALERLKADRVIATWTKRTAPFPNYSVYF